MMPWRRRTLGEAALDPFRPVSGGDAPPASAPRQRGEASDAVRRRAERRLRVTAGCFLVAFLTVGLKMGGVALSEPRESDGAGGALAVRGARADVVDRSGRVLATNVTTTALYAQPHLMVDPAAAARGLAKIFPDMDAAAWEARFRRPGARFAWVRPSISPEQRQAVHDLGEPGLLFARRDKRLFPAGPMAAHVLGGTRYGAQDVRAAELVGVAGIEAAFQDRLSDPARTGEPLRLTLDLPVQTAVERVLAGGMRLTGAKGASAIVMDIDTGAVRAMASLPDFDPNARPAPATEGDPAESPLFNRAVQGVYELGSTFKLFTAAQALELKLVSPATLIDTKGPMRQGRHRIRDFHDYGPRLTVRDVIVKSSNIGTARLALDIGSTRLRDFLAALGFYEPTPIELAEAPGSAPIVPSRWPDITTMTVSYGHGLSASPLHLASAYATLLGGGERVRPTLLEAVAGVAKAGVRGERVLSGRVSSQMLDMARAVVTEGTATMAEVDGYAVAGKTGTADKPKHTGGYYDDKVIATFAGAFPAHDPRYVLVVTLDEPEVEALGERRRTAGWTAVPVAAEVVRRAAPLLGLRPAG